MISHGSIFVKTAVAGLLMQLNRADEAVQILEQNRHKVVDQQSIDNMLIAAYQKSGQYDQAISLLQRNLSKVATNVKKTRTALFSGTVFPPRLRDTRQGPF